MRGRQWFETVELDNEEETPPQWDVIVMSSTFMANLDPEDLDGYELDDEWLSKEELFETHANSVFQYSNVSKSKERWPGFFATVSTSNRAVSCGGM